MSLGEHAEITTTEEEESPSVDPFWRRREIREYSPIRYSDGEMTIHCRIQHATRKLWLLVGQWQRLFPLPQWRAQHPRGEAVLRDSGLLRHIVPFVRRINSLDGIVWYERYEGTVRVYYQDPGPFW